MTIYKRSRGVEPDTTWNKSSWWSGRDLLSGSPDFKSGALTTRPRCLSYICKSTYISMYVCIYVYVYICIYMYVYVYVCTYIFIYLLKTELRILDFQHFHWLAGHRLSAHIPALPNMVNESINKESWIKDFSRNWRPLKIV